MKEAFELEPVERLEITDGVYLAAYAGVRAPAPLELTLYRVGARRLDPGAALRLLPPAIEPGDTGHVLPMGAGAASQTDPPEPLDRAGP